MLLHIATERYQIMRKSNKVSFCNHIAPYSTGYQSRKKGKKEPAIVSNDGPVKLKGKEREKSQK
jgi:hypothetical protein